MADRPPSSFGLELRRLRRGRSFAEMAERSRGVLDEVTLAKLEKGELEPNLDWLVSLASACGTTTDHLLAARDLDQGSAPREPIGLYDGDDLTRRFAEDLKTHPHRALRLASHGEATASSPRQLHRWRCNRALALHAVGKLDLAHAIFLACAEDKEAPNEHRAQAYRALADVLTDSGYFDAAADMASRALFLHGNDAPEERLQMARRTKARIVLFSAEHDLNLGREVDREEVGLAFDLVMGPEPDEDASLPTLVSCLLRATIHKLLDGPEDAVELMEAVLAASRDKNTRNRYIEGHALLGLGRLYRQADDVLEAAPLLRKAAVIFNDQGRADDEFSARYELVECDLEDRLEALDACRRLHPQVSSRSPWVLAYERLVGETHP
ncbi:MAG: helix-turn-helix domain-containing protein [Acidobacteriota bacterium]